MLVKNIVVKACVTDCEASELAGVPVDISAALYRSRNQAELEQLFVKESCVTAEIAKKVANFSPDVGILVTNQHFEIGVNVSVVDGLIKVFADPCQLAYQRETVHDQVYATLLAEKLVLGDCCEAPALHKLLGEVL